MVEIGKVETFPGVKPDKEQVMKMAEEVMEVFSQWEDFDDSDMTCRLMPDVPGEAYKKACVDGILLECADVIQATCNLIAALGVEDFTGEMRACRRRNEARGRFE